MTIRVQVLDDDGVERKKEAFHDPIDLIAWVCRCYQATRRAHGTKAAFASLMLAMSDDAGVR